LVASVTLRPCRFHSASVVRVKLPTSGTPNSQQCPHATSTPNSSPSTAFNLVMAQRSGRDREREHARTPTATAAKYLSLQVGSFPLVMGAGAYQRLVVELGDQQRVEDVDLSNRKVHDLVSQLITFAHTICTE
jgi:hypothetical protein